MQQLSETTLYTHSTRPQWGLAILAWEGRDKRRYQFQDGKLRTFKKGYYELMEPVDELDADARKTVRDLKTMLGAARHRFVEDMHGAAETAQAPTVTLDQQIAYFQTLYPEGFADPKYLAEVRGEGDARRKKRHRDAAIAEAREKLERSALETRGGIDRLVEVLGNTDLVPPKDVKMLESIPEGKEPVLRDALRDLLWGDEAYQQRFRRWIDSIAEATGQRPSWQLATAPSALVHPEEHVCVRPTALRAQAKTVAPDLRYRAKPHARLYDQFLSVASIVKTRLEQKELPPRDMVDVYELVWLTLRRKALEQMGA